MSFEKEKPRASTPNPHGRHSLALQGIYYAAAALTFISIASLFNANSPDICKPQPAPQTSAHKKAPPVEALGAPYLLKRFCDAIGAGPN